MPRTQGLLAGAEVSFDTDNDGNPLLVVIVDGGAAGLAHVVLDDGGGNPPVLNVIPGDGAGGPAEVILGSGSGAYVGNVGLVAGSQNIGNVAFQANSTVGLLPSATNSGAANAHKLQSAATTNATSVKGSNGILTGGSARNTTASAKFLKFYNKASAPTVGTDVATMIIGIPPNASINLGEVFGAAGYRLATGIAYALTGAYANSDTTALAAADVEVNLLYN